MKNGNRKYLLSTSYGLKQNEKAEVHLGEVRKTGDSNFVLYSLCDGQENRELVAVILDKSKSKVDPS